MPSPPTRRTFLRGLGTAVALPWLESRAWARGAPSPPVRLVYVYAPNGVHVPDWRIREPGPLAELPWILEPLAPHKGALTVISGLTHDKGRANGDGPGDHARAAATWLTGVQPHKPDGAVRLGVSADQLAARVVGRHTRLRSLVLGCEQGRSAGQCDSGYACAYSSSISWEGPQTPSSKSVDPGAVFDLLFTPGDDPVLAAERRARGRSVLDFVRADAAALGRRLGAEDRRRLDAYLTGLREVERRLALEDRGGGSVGGTRPQGKPAGLARHARLLADLVVLALRGDVTRVVTFMLANEGSNRSYPELGVAQGHHALSHHKGKQDAIQAIRRINRHHVQLFAHLLDGLAAVREGDGSLLDASLVVYGSGLADGNAHHHHDLPLVVAGGGGGSLRPGRHVAFPRETPMNDLHLALLERVGVRVPVLGDSSGVLAL